LPAHPTFAAALPGEKAQTKYCIFIKSSTKSKLHKNTFFHIFVNLATVHFQLSTENGGPLNESHRHGDTFSVRRH